MIFRNILVALLTLGLAGLAMSACDSGNVVVPDDQENLVTHTVALSFVTWDVETACGDALGIRVVISDGEESMTCEAPWALAMVSDPYTSPGDQGSHHVADCFFVLPAGEYYVEEVAVLGADLEPLECCTASYPEVVEVNSGMTTEFGAELSCELIGPGALDIYGWLNRPPVILDLTIHPSKFAAPCMPRFLHVMAYDKEGDTIGYTWEVLFAPKPTFYGLWGHGPWAAFVGFTPGAYTLRVTVFDIPHGLSTSLIFPLHVGEPAYHGSMTLEAGCTEIEPPLPEYAF